MAILDRFDIKGRSALVTGAASGIGRACEVQVAAVLPHHADGQLRPIDGFEARELGLLGGVGFPVLEHHRADAQAGTAQRQDQAQAQGQQQDPNAIFLQAAAEEAVAKAAQARANTIKTVADAELSRAKTAETLAKTGEIDQNMALTATEGLREACLQCLEDRKSVV